MVLAKGLGASPVGLGHPDATGLYRTKEGDHASGKGLPQKGTGGSVSAEPL